MTMSCLAIWRGDELGLRRFIFVGHLGRVAAGALAFDPGHLLDEHRLGAEALDLLPGGGADVGRGDDRAEPAGGGDRLQPGDPDAHHEDPGGGDGAGRGHHHREGPAIFRRGVEHRLVAGEIGLAGEHVHRLGPGDSRHQLHRQRLEPRRGISVDPLALPERVEHGDDQRAGLRALERRRIRALHGEDRVGAGERRLARADGRAGGLVIGIGDGSGEPGPGLDRDLGAQRDELLHRLRSRRDPALGLGRLLQDRKLHRLSIRGSGG